ncbi:coniferyl-aldehyde dehydrogenase, partial [Oleiphilus sp. HI0122]
MVADVVQISESKSQIKKMKNIYQEQLQAFRRNPMPSYEERIANLKKLRQALLDNQETFIAKISEDFDGRSADETRLAEIMPVLHTIDYTIKNLKSWMQSDKKKVSALFMPASTRVQYQPLGVVGIIAPWNYTISLSLGPLVSALAAGNRTMIKMSEFTPVTSAYVEELVGKIFPENLVAVINGEADVAVEFSDIPWNHLLFTGSTSVGRHVMRAASANLTPVTLELGGKSPTIISETVDIDEAVKPIVFGKAFNAGQTCIAPDYILCPEHRIEAFVERFQRYFAEMYPTLKHNNDFTSVINDRQYKRLQSYVADAEEKGATVVMCNHAGEDMADGTRKMPIHL